MSRPVCTQKEISVFKGVEKRVTHYVYDTVFCSLVVRCSLLLFYLQFFLGVKEVWRASLKIFDVKSCLKVACL